MIEVDVFEGTLVWDGRVLELFRNDGKQGSFRVLGDHVQSTEIERRKDRLHVKFAVTDRFYEAVEVGLDQEAAITDLIARLG